MPKLTVSSGGQIAPPIKKLAATANREHQRATECASNAIEHAVLAGEALAKIRELSDLDRINAMSSGSYHVRCAADAIRDGINLLNNLIDEERAALAAGSSLQTPDPAPPVQTPEGGCHETA